MKERTTYAWIVCALVCTAAWGEGTPRYYAEPFELCEEPFERAARTLKQTLESQTGVEAHVRTSILNQARDMAGNPQVFDVLEQHYIETAAGQRFEEAKCLSGTKVVMRWQDYCDSEKSAHVAFTNDNPEIQSTVAINRAYWNEDATDRRNAPVHLQFLYVGRKPLPRALSGADYLGESKVLDRTCDNFLFRRVNWYSVQDQVFALDRETGIPLKVAAYDGDDTRQADKPLWVWSADFLDQVDGFFVPLRSTNVAFGADGKPTTTWKSKIERIEFNKSYPVSSFWPQIEKTATVFDSFTKKIRRGSNAQLTAELGNGATPEATIAAPATRPTDWLQWASYLIAFLGITALVAAFVIRRRQA